MSIVYIIGNKEFVRNVNKSPYMLELMAFRIPRVGPMRTAHLLRV